MTQNFAEFYRDFHEIGWRLALGPITVRFVCCHLADKLSCASHSHLVLLPDMVLPNCDVHEECYLCKKLNLRLSVPTRLDVRIMHHRIEIIIFIKT